MNHSEKSRGTIIWANSTIKLVATPIVAKTNVAREAILITKNIGIHSRVLDTNSLNLVYRVVGSLNLHWSSLQYSKT